MIEHLLCAHKIRRLIRRYRYLFCSRFVSFAAHGLRHSEETRVMTRPASAHTTQEVCARFTPNQSHRRHHLCRRVIGSPGSLHRNFYRITANRFGVSCVLRSASLALPLSGCQPPGCARAFRYLCLFGRTLLFARLHFFLPVRAAEAAGAILSFWTHFRLSSSHYGTGRPATHPIHIQFNIKYLSFAPNSS